MTDESSLREVLAKVTDIAGEIRNLSHYAWTDRENAEFLFRGIEQRGKLIQHELAALASQSPSDRSLREVLKREIAEKVQKILLKERECEDCGEVVKGRRFRCKKCKKLVCSWCKGHVHE